MSDMRHTAQQLAAQGRFGDTMLLHVSPAEVDGIASLIPGGLTINPRTGLPEAFFFLPFLASLFGAAAPAAAGVAAAAAPALAAGAGAAAAGVGAATAAAPAVLGTLGAVGAPSAAMTAGTLASAASAAPSAFAGGLGALKTGIGSLFGAPGAAAPAAAAAPVGTAGVGGGGGINLLGGTGTGGVGGGGGINLLKTASLPPPIVHQTPTSIAGSAVAPTTSVAPALGTFPPPPPPPTAGGGIKGLFTMKNLPMMMMGASALSNAVGGLFQKKEKEEKGKSTKGMKYKNTSDEGGPSFPGDDYRPGFSNEHNYFPNYKYANGGIVTLADGGMVDPQMQQPQDMSFPMNGVPGTDEAPMLEDIPSSPYPSSQIGTMPEPPPEATVEPTTNNDRELIAQTVEAIQGKVQDPGPILLAFVQEFGEPALQDLAQRVKSMPKGGPDGPVNDGQSDSIPAMIQGRDGSQQPAALSEGEFVIPADAVSGLGNGSTDAGAQQLQGMVDNVRTMRGGGPVQPPNINPRQVMPYAGGGLVSLTRSA